jgi:uncharacterized protein
MNQLLNAFTLFLSLLVEAIPFLLLGVMLSSILLIFVNEQQLLARIPRNPFLAALSGSLLGFMFPVCECGNVPVARRLIGKGAPMSMAVGFLLAAPTINPIVIWATWTAFRDQPEIVILRVVFSLAIATTIGTIFGIQKDMRPFLKSSLALSLPLSLSAPLSLSSPSASFQSNFSNSDLPNSNFPSSNQNEPRPRLPATGTFFLGESNQSLQSLLIDNQNIPKSTSDRFQLLLTNTISEFRELGGVLVIGSAIAAIIQVWVPRDLILALGQGPVSSILAMMILAIVVSICSTVDAFFALSFAATFTSGSLLAFLIFGPMVDLKSIGLMLTIFERRAIIYLFTIAALLTFLFCLFLNLQVR